MSICCISAFIPIIMNQNPLISIIIPVYNVEDYIRPCLDSILAQTYTNFEAILVDDGSKDGSGRICDEYAEKDSRFIVVHKENGGVSSARNKGLEIAKGEWVLFCDSDDTLYPYSLIILIKHIDKDIEFILGGYEHYNSKGEIVYSIKDRACTLISKSKVLKYMYKPKLYSYLGLVASKLYKLSIINEYNIKFNESVFYNEDRLFAVNYLTKITKKCIYDTTPVYKYFIRESSAMGILNHKFDKKFVTDFDAFILMKQYICDSTNNYYLKYLAQLNIIYSGQRILQLMKKYKIIDPEISQHIHSGIKEHVGKLPLIRYQAGRIKRFVKRIFLETKIKTVNEAI